MKAKQTAGLRTLTVLLALLLTGTGCGRPTPPDTQPDTAESAATAASAAAYTPPDAAGSREAAYEAVIGSLEDKLLQEKTDRYISDSAYEETISRLRAQLDSLRGDGCSVQVDTQPPFPVTDAVTDPSRDTGAEPQAAASLRYGIVGGEAVIYALLGGSPDLVIPASIGGYPVAVIADDAVRGADITSVILPDTVREIGWFAFADCPHLRTAVLPDSLSSVGYGAFSGCPAVTAICAPDTYAAAWAKSCGMAVRSPQ